MTFGEQLRLWRIESKLNQRDLAARVGIDFTYLSKIENGRMPPPSEATIMKMAEALEQDADMLLQLAFRVPQDVKPIITGSREAPTLLRAIQGLSET
ncbi:MAG TPA: helix-turn-helix transcriptional regulator, partial [Armatimonadota bacterium]|nr:helix-turn-helix transcriptional regulator [Armatimonadota bacterium]